MMCQRIGRSPTGTIGLGRNSVSSRRRVPRPPQKITTFIDLESLCNNRAHRTGRPPTINPKLRAPDFAGGLEGGEGVELPEPLGLRWQHPPPKEALCWKKLLL